MCATGVDKSILKLVHSCTSNFCFLYVNKLPAYRIWEHAASFKLIEIARRMFHAEINAHRFKTCSLTYFLKYIQVRWLWNFNFTSTSRTHIHDLSTPDVLKSSIPESEYIALFTITLWSLVTSKELFLQRPMLANI